MSDLPPSRRDEREAQLAACEAALLKADPSYAANLVPWLIAEVRSLSQQLDEAKALHAKSRWNIEGGDDGVLKICRGEHERHEGCDFETFVPASALDEAKADSARLDFLDSVEDVSVDLPSAVGARRIATYSLDLNWRADRGDDAHALREVLDAAMTKDRERICSPRA